MRSSALRFAAQRATKVPAQVLKVCSLTRSACLMRTYLFAAFAAINCQLMLLLSEIQRLLNTEQLAVVNGGCCFWHSLCHLFLYVEPNPRFRVRPTAATISNFVVIP